MDGGPHVEGWTKMMLDSACTDEHHLTDIIPSLVYTADFLNKSFQELTGRSYLITFLGGPREVPAIGGCGARELVHNTAVPLLLGRLCERPSFRAIKVRNARPLKRSRRVGV